MCQEWVMLDDNYAIHLGMSMLCVREYIHLLSKGGEVTVQMDVCKLPFHGILTVYMLVAVIGLCRVHCGRLSVICSECNCYNNDRRCQRPFSALRPVRVLCNDVGESDTRSVDHIGVCDGP